MSREILEGKIPAQQRLSHLEDINLLTQPLPKSFVTATLDLADTKEVAAMVEDSLKVFENYHK